eukprot:31379-Pelagococcus_subviridis.AAC.42
MPARASFSTVGQSTTAGAFFLTLARITGPLSRRFIPSSSETRSSLSTSLSGPAGPHFSNAALTQSIAHSAGAGVAGRDARYE